MALCTWVSGMFCYILGAEFNSFAGVTYLTFDRLCKFVDLKKKQNRMHLCLKVNEKQRKCHMNCVSRMPERRVIMWYVGIGKICNRSFRPWSSGKKGETRGHAVLGADPAVGPNSPRLRSREKFKCPRLANVKNEYNL